MVDFETNKNVFTSYIGVVSKLVVDFEANKNVFIFYTDVGDEEKKVYVSDLRTTPVLGKEKNILKLNLKIL